jgi:transposase
MVDTFADQRNGIKTGQGRRLLANGLNANLVRRWVLESDPAHKSATRAAPFPAMSAPSPQAQGASVSPGFVPLALNAPSADIRIELRQGDQLITVYWPMAAAAQCLSALQDWLR